MNTDQELLDYRSASLATGLCVNTLYALVCQKRIPHIRLSRRLVRFRRSELERWLDERAVPVGGRLAGG